MAQREPMRVVVLGDKDARRSALMEMIQGLLNAQGVEWKRGVDSVDIESVVIVEGVA